MLLAKKVICDDCGCKLQNRISFLNKNSDVEPIVICKEIRTYQLLVMNNSPPSSN